MYSCDPEIIYCIIFSISFLYKLDRAFQQQSHVSPGIKDGVTCLPQTARINSTYTVVGCLVRCSLNATIVVFFFFFVVGSKRTHALHTTPLMPTFTTAEIHWVARTPTCVDILPPPSVVERALFDCGRKQNSMKIDERSERAEPLNPKGDRNPS